MKKITIVFLLTLPFGIHLVHSQTKVESKVIIDSKLVNFELVDSKKGSSWLYKISSKTKIEGTIEIIDSENKVIASDVFQSTLEGNFNKLSVYGTKNFLYISIKSNKSEIYKEKIYITN